MKRKDYSTSEERNRSPETVRQRLAVYLQARNKVRFVDEQTRSENSQLKKASSKLLKALLQNSRLDSADIVREYVMVPIGLFTMFPNVRDN